MEINQDILFCSYLYYCYKTIFEMPIVLYYDRFNLYQWNWQMDPYVNHAEFQRPAVKLPHHNGINHGTVPLLNLQPISNKANTRADAGARSGSVSGKETEAGEGAGAGAGAGAG